MKYHNIVFWVILVLAMGMSTSCSKEDEPERLFVDIEFDGEYVPNRGVRISPLGGKTQMFVNSNCEVMLSLKCVSVPALRCSLSKTQLKAGASVVSMSFIKNFLKENAKYVLRVRCKASDGYWYDYSEEYLYQESATKYEDALN